MVAKFLDHSNKELTQWWRRQQQDQQKSSRHRKTITLHVHHTFLYIFQSSFHNYNVKLPNFTHLCYGLCEHDTKISSFFLNLDTALSISNWIRSMKVETVQIHFLSDVFSLLSSRSFTTMTRWCNDFFSLLMTMDNCNGLFFGMQMHLEKKPSTVFVKNTSVMHSIPSYG